MDKETALLLQIAFRLRARFISKDDPWEASPFGWIRGLPSRRVGSFAEELVTEWLRFHGFRVEPSQILKRTV